MGSILSLRDEDSKPSINYTLVKKRKDFTNIVEFLLKEVNGVHVDSNERYVNKLTTLRNIIDGEINSFEVESIKNMRTYQEFVKKK